jgi:hypothetical protein
MPSNDVYLEMRIHSRELAHTMVQLDGWARDAYERGKFIHVSEINTRREAVQEQRSALLREIWSFRS